MFLIKAIDIHKIMWGFLPDKLSGGVTRGRFKIFNILHRIQFWHANDYFHVYTYRRYEETIQKHTCTEAGKCLCYQMGPDFITDCSNLHLTSIPKLIPPNTTRLLLSGNEFETIFNNSFKNLHALTFLDLNNCKTSKSFWKQAVQ